MAAICRPCQTCDASVELRADSPYAGRCQDLFICKDLITLSQQLFCFAAHLAGAVTGKPLFSAVAFSGQGPFLLYGNLVCWRRSQCKGSYVQGPGHCQASICHRQMPCLVGTPRRLSVVLICMTLPVEAHCCDHGTAQAVHYTRTALRWRGRTAGNRQRRENTTIVCLSCRRPRPGVEMQTRLRPNTGIRRTCACTDSTTRRF